MTDLDLDPDGALAALFADPAPDPGFAARVDALIRADRLYAAERRRAWRRFGQEAVGAIAVAAAAALVAAAPDPGWRLALVAAAVPAAWLVACVVRPLDSAAGRGIATG